MTKKEPVKFALLGAGTRGELDLGYFFLKHHKKIRYSAVAEPDSYRRRKFVKKFNIPEENAFSDYKDLLEKPKLADAILNALPCRMHYESTMAAMNARYDVLLEKPMAHTAAECIKLADTAKKLRRKLSIVFENRYNDIYQEMRAILDQKKIGQVIDLTCKEDIGYWHYVASYVRGIHSRADLGNSFMIAKGIHDMDLIYWLLDSRAKQISSFGNLAFFNEENAPEGSPEFCVEGCPVQEDCIFDALKQYYEPGRPKMPFKLLKNQKILGSLIDMIKEPRFRTFASMITRDLSKSNILKVLKESPHGKCVFHSDNGVTDHQTTSIEFENGITCSFSLSAFSVIWERDLHLRGTGGEILSRDFTGHLELRTFDPAEVKTQKIRYNGLHHGGGDGALLLDFAEAIRNTDPQASSMTQVENCLEGHLMALAAEEARLENKAVDMEKFRKRAEEEARALS